MKRGFTLLEVIISLLVLGIVFAVISNYVAMTFNYTSSNQDVSFANVKTNQIIEELKSYIRKGEEKGRNIWIILMTEQAIIQF